ENLAALGRSGAGLLGALGVSVEAGAANIHADDWHLSLSVTSAMSRLVGSDAPPILKLVATGTVALAVLGLVWTLYRMCGRSLFGRDEVLDYSGRARMTGQEWSGLIVACLAFGPQTTGRHFVLLLPVHAMIAAVLTSSRVMSDKVPLIAGVVLFQLAMVLPP